MDLESAECIHTSSISGKKVVERADGSPSRGLWFTDEWVGSTFIPGGGMPHRLCGRGVGFPERSDMDHHYSNARVQDDSFHVVVSRDTLPLG